MENGIPTAQGIYPFFDELHELHKAFRLNVSLYAVRADFMVILILPSTATALAVFQMYTAKSVLWSMVIQNVPPAAWASAFLENHS
jgi:hypothetical protein